MKRHYVYPLLTLCLIALGFLYPTIQGKKIERGLCLSHITSSLPFDADWKTSPPEEDLAPIFQQTFHYLGKGSQMFAFESEDQRYVLKLFRHNRYQIPTWMQNLPYPRFLKSIQEDRLRTKQDKFKNLMMSCKIADTELKEESGLIYLHLNKSQYLNYTLRVEDAMGRKYILNADDYEFVLQKKADLVITHLQKLLQQGQYEEAESALASLTNLLTTRFQKHIGDADPAIVKNAGFLPGSQPIFIDIGQFYHSEMNTETSLSEMDRILRPIKEWLITSN